MDLNGPFVLSLYVDSKAESGKPEKDGETRTETNFKHE